jgi:hypothetical protein
VASTTEPTIAATADATITASRKGAVTPSSSVAQLGDSTEFTRFQGKP